MIIHEQKRDEDWESKTVQSEGTKDWTNINEGYNVLIRDVQRFLWIEHLFVTKEHHYPYQPNEDKRPYLRENPLKQWVESKKWQIRTV